MSNLKYDPKLALEYEFHMCDYHRANICNDVWHWKYIPEEQLFNAGFITSFNKLRLSRKKRKEEGNNNIREYGLDGLALDSNGFYHGLQAKYWHKKRLTGHDLGTFFSVISNRLRVINIYIYI